MSGNNILKRSISAREGSLSPPPVKRKLESTTTKKAVASFFTPVSKKEPEKITWRVVNRSLLVGASTPEPSSTKNDAPAKKRRKIAAFDFDSTLIQTSSGNVFGKSSTDWRWWDSSVPGVLRQLYFDGSQVVVISNQGGISLKSEPKTVKSDQKRLSDFKAKVSLVFAQLGFPIAIYAATARDQYRKPRTGMWHELIEELDLDVGDGPDLAGSIFVGDAGGRQATNGGKGDHSCSDRDFAVNVGIDFKTPEEYFLQQPPQPYSRSFSPRAYLSLVAISPADTAPILFDRKNILDLVLFCGSPGAGKSKFYWDHLKPLGYERVNQDTLKTRDRCIKVASDYLSEGRSVAVDNTNAEPATRNVWIQLARKMGVPVRCVLFTAPPKLCEHNDTVRALNDGTLNPERRSILPHSAFSSFAARYRKPKTTEGFQDIVRMDFQVSGSAHLVMGSTLQRPRFTDD
ncbi:hypothetical protein MMC08_004076 [Hypocenomyce scalaris]|nr:hypothetical protein [Hypocenomyce scalaris]